MAQFQAYRNPNARSLERAPYLLDVQSDLVDLKARVVVMLVVPAYFGHRMRGLNPVLKVEGRDYVMSTIEIGAIQSRRLGEPVANLAAQRQEISAALDFMLNGF